MNTKLLLASVYVAFLLPISTLSAQRATFENGVIVMDASGMKRATKGGKWRSTTAKNDSSPTSTGLNDIATNMTNAQVYHKLRISKKDIGLYDWKSAIDSCLTYVESGTNKWRSPTQKEMILMMILRDDIESCIAQNELLDVYDSFRDTEYWTATNYIDMQASHWAWAVNLRSRQVVASSAKTDKRYVRCVKEL